MAGSTLDDIGKDVWPAVLIAVGGALILAVVVILVVGCSCYWYRRRRRRTSEYRSLLSASPVDDGDCISYGSLTDSMEMRREEEKKKKEEEKKKKEEEKKKKEEEKEEKPTEETDSKPPKMNDRKSVKKEVTAVEQQAVQATGGEGGGGRREVGLYEAMEYKRRSKEMNDRESMLLACQFHIRNAQNYTLLKTLPDMGSRMQKYWFLVDPIGDSSLPSHLLLTILPVSKQCPIKLQGASLQTLNELLAVLKHPFLHPLREIDYIQDKQCVIVVQSFVKRGSLKDLIYKAQPTDDWSVKYSTKKKGLPVETVALFGRQILEVLVLLYRRGFPSLGHVHSGNVLVEDKVCRLAGFENTLLGYKTRLYKLLKEHLNAIDVIMFGHLMFEMCCGYELTELAPTQTDYQVVRYKPVVEVLQFIFSSDSGTFPTIREVLELPFFQQANVPQLSEWDPEQLCLTTDMKALLRAVRKGRPAHTTTTQPAPHPKPRKRTNEVKQKYPVTPLRPPSADRRLSRPTSQSVSFTAPPPPTGPPPTTPGAPLTTPSVPLATPGAPLTTPSAPPTTPRAPPPRKVAPPPRPPKSNKNRGALLSDIRKGSKLKKTVTNDRSAPKI